MYKLVIGSKYQLDGQEKTRWTHFGYGYEKKDSNMTIRLDHSIIVPPGESIWLNLFKEGESNGISQKNEQTEKS